MVKKICKCEWQKSLTPRFSYLLLQEPRSGKDEGDVGDHVDHGGPRDREGGHAVVALEDGGDDDELRPLEGVRGGVEHEEEEDQPTPTVVCCNLEHSAEFNISCTILDQCQDHFR